MGRFKHGNKIREDYKEELLFIQLILYNFDIWLSLNFERH